MALNYQSSGAYVNTPTCYSSPIVAYLGNEATSPVHSVTNEPPNTPTPDIFSQGFNQSESITFNSSGHSPSDRRSESGSCSISGAHVDVRNAWKMPTNLPWKGPSVPFSPFFPKVAPQVLLSGKYQRIISDVALYPPRAEENASSISYDFVAPSSCSSAPVEKEVEKKSGSITSKVEKRGLVTTINGRSKKDHNKHFFIARRLKKKMHNKNKLLRKTELCTYWMRSSTCTFKSNCHFAHGADELISRARQGNFKTQPCLEFTKCLYGSRCNYCHPGEGLRRVVGSTYLDADYFNELREDFGENQYPFGMYI